MPYRWPTDPPGTPPRHSIPFDQHRIRQGLQGARVGGKPVSYAQWKSGGFLRALQGGGKPGAPAAGAPKPAAPGSGPPLPVDPTYDSQLNAAAANRDATMAGLTGQRTRGLLDYGYIEGAGGALRLDPNNPMSKAAQLKRNYDVERRSTGQTMGSGGQLYAGAYQNAQDLVNRNQLGAQDSLQKALSDFLAQNTGERTKAGTDYQQQAAQYGAERLDRIANNPLYSPTATAPEVKAGKPKATAKPRAAAPKKYRWPGEKTARHSRPYRGR